MLMIGSLFIGAIILTPVKWAMWFFALFFYANVVHMLTCGFKSSTDMRGSSVARTYSLLCIVVLTAWTALLFLWIPTDGTHMVPVTLAVFLCGGVDVVAKFIFGVIFLSSDAVKKGVARRVSSG